jgi:hypothetical protein
LVGDCGLRACSQRPSATGAGRPRRSGTGDCASGTSGGLAIVPGSAGSAAGLASLLFLSRPKEVIAAMRAKAPAYHHAWVKWSRALAEMVDERAPSA